MASKLITIAVFNDDTGWALDQAHVDRIVEAAGGENEVRQARNYTELLELLPETNYLMSYPLTEDHLESGAPNLEWIQLIASTGDMNPALSAAMDRGIRISTAAPIRGPQVAEHALSLALALTRRLKEAIVAQSEHRWETTYLSTQMTELDGAEVCVVGASAIGRAIGERLVPFGARVTLFDVAGGDEAPPPEGVSIRSMSSLDGALASADMVIIACPMLPSTEGLFDQRRFTLMQDGALLVDVSRGGIVDERSLLLALRRSRIALAGLDVFASEPLSPTSPLWTMPNVILTPHVCAATPKYWDRATDVVCENLRRLGAGSALLDEALPSWYGAAASV